MALNIAINEDYRITSDSMNVIVLRRYIVDPSKSPNWAALKAKLEAEGKPTGPRDDWREQSYHGTVAQALQAIGESKVRGSDAETLAELLAEIRQFNGEMRALLAVEGQR